MKRRKQEDCTPRFKKLQGQSKDKLTLALIPYEIHCGFHSGFPECCIKFWVTKWTWADPDSSFKKKHWKLLRKHDVGYIPCPKCLRNKTFVDVKPCPKSCRLKILLWGKDWIKSS